MIDMFLLRKGVYNITTRLEVLIGKKYNGYDLVDNALNVLASSSIEAQSNDCQSDDLCRQESGEISLLS